MKHQLCHPHTYYIYPYMYILHISWKIILVNVKMTRIRIFHIYKGKRKKIELSFKIMTFCLKVYPLMLQPLQLKQSYYNWFVKTISGHFNSTEIIFSLVDIKTYNFVSILWQKKLIYVLVRTYFFAKFKIKKFKTSVNRFH